MVRGDPDVALLGAWRDANQVPRITQSRIPRRGLDLLFAAWMRLRSLQALTLKHSEAKRMSSAIERFQGPGNIEDAILLVVSSGLHDFIRNTLFSIERSGAAENMICIALPKHALSEVRSAVSRWTNIKYIILEEIFDSDYSWIQDYHKYGTEAFHRFTTSKWLRSNFFWNPDFDASRIPMLTSHG